MDLLVVRDPEAIEQEWNRWLESQTDTSPFCHPLFIRGLNKLFGWDNALIQVDDQFSAWCTLRKRGPLVDLVVPPLTQFTPMVGRPDASMTHLQKSIASLMLPHKDLPFSRKLSIPPVFGRPSLGELPPRCHHDTKKTFHVACAPIEEAISSWSSSHRRTFRHEKDRYQFHVNTGSAADIAKLTDDAYRRGGSRLAVSPAHLTPFVERLSSAGLAKTVHVTDSSGDLRAGIILLQSREMAWYWVAGSHRGPAMTVLLGHTLAHLHEHGIKTLDLVGANTPAIAEFKRRFGGVEVEYEHFSRRSTIIDVVERAAKRRLSSGGAKS